MATSASGNVHMDIVAWTDKSGEVVLGFKFLFQFHNIIGNQPTARCLRLLRRQVYIVNNSTPSRVILLE